MDEGVGWDGRPRHLERRGCCARKRSNEGQEVSEARDVGHAQWRGDQWADAARLAEEFEADDTVLVGVEITFPRRAGRPSPAGGTGTSPQVIFGLSPSARDRAERLATDGGTTVSALAREALGQFVKKAG